jgi:hypothetical protein
VQATAPLIQLEIATSDFRDLRVCLTYYTITNCSLLQTGVQSVSTVAIRRWKRFPGHVPVVAETQSSKPTNSILKGMFKHFLEPHHSESDQKKDEDCHDGGPSIGRIGRTKRFSTIIEPKTLLINRK